VTVSDATRLVLLDVRAERSRQDAIWGAEDHPDGTGPLAGWTVDDVPAYAVADMAKNITVRAALQGRVTWRDILLEEVAEALAEDDPDPLRAELVQVAAVAAAWVEAIDRRTQAGAG